MSAANIERLRWGELRLSTKLCFLGLLLLLLVGGAEIASRIYWSACQGARGAGAAAIWRTFYPEMATSGIDQVAAGHAADSFDVLLLGGSVVYPAFGKINERLESALQDKLGRKVRLVNLSYPGRTSLDSRLKYEYAADKRWDLVLVYHGINDVYLNNCPPGKFRSNYAHAYRRYGAQYDLRRHTEVGLFELPFTVTFLAKSLPEHWNLTSAPGKNYQMYGNDIRTPPSFEANLEAIAVAAEKRGDPVVLSTFAYYLPANYSEDAFRAKALDYGSHSCPARMWGEAPNVARTLDLHNEAVRRVADRHGLTLIDQRANMPDGKRYYNDPCHLTDEGCARWVENVISGLDLAKIGRH
jgi:GDSL-like Lipase/Acylhydrolase family